MLVKSNKVVIPLSEICSIKKFFFFEKTIELNIGRISLLSNVVAHRDSTERRDLYPDLKELIENNEGSFIVVNEYGKSVETYTFSLDDDSLYIDMDFSADVRAVNMKTQNEFRTYLDNEGKSLERNLKYQIDEFKRKFNVREISILQSRFNFKVDSRYRNNRDDYYDRYRDDDDFLTYYFMYQLFSDDSYNENIYFLNDEDERIDPDELKIENTDVMKFFDGEMNYEEFEKNNKESDNSNNNSSDDLAAAVAVGAVAGYALSQEDEQQNDEVVDENVIEETVFENTSEDSIEDSGMSAAAAEDFSLEESDSDTSDES